MGDCSMRSSFLGEECPSLYLFEFATPIQQQRCAICEARCGSRVAKDCVGSTAQRNPMVPEKRAPDPWNRSVPGIGQNVSPNGLSCIQTKSVPGMLGGFPVQNVPPGLRHWADKCC
jgi:hypothetical protein